MDYKQLEKEQYKRVAMNYIDSYSKIDIETGKLTNENRLFLIGILSGLQMVDIISGREWENKVKEINNIYTGENEQ